MKREQAEDLPVDYMQLRRLKETGFSIPHNTFLKAHFHCCGDLRIDLLVDAIAQVMIRHDALSNTFYETTSGFAQRRASAADLEVHFSAAGADLAAGPGDGSFYRPFDLRSGPFLRVRLAREAPSSADFQLEFAAENFVIDGYSLRLILGEVSQNYNQLLSGEHREQVPASQQSEYARWQRSELTPFRIRSVYDAWASELYAGSGQIQQPDADTAPMWRSPRITCRARRALDAIWLHGFGEWAKSQRTTRFAAASAVYGYCLAKTEAADSSIFLTTVLGRTREEHFRLVGNLANTLPLRLSPRQPAGSLTEWAREAKRAVGFALTYQDLPLSMIHDELLRRAGKHVDLGELSFFTLKEPLNLSLSGVTCREIDGMLTADAVLPHSSRLKLSADDPCIETIYDPDRVSGETVNLLQGHIADVEFPGVKVPATGSLLVWCYATGCG